MGMAALEGEVDALIHRSKVLGGFWKHVLWDAHLEHRGGKLHRTTSVRNLTPKQDQGWIMLSFSSFPMLHIPVAVRMWLQTCSTFSFAPVQRFSGGMLVLRPTLSTIHATAVSPWKGETGLPLRFDQLNDLRSHRLHFVHGMELPPVDLQCPELRAAVGGCGGGIGRLILDKQGERFFVG